jgi:UDP-glucose 4-epimerase
MNNQIINIGTGVKTNIEHLLDLLMRYSGVKKPIIVEGNTLGDQFGIYADNEKLKRCIDYDFTPIERGIELFVKSQMQ